MRSYLFSKVARLQTIPFVDSGYNLPKFWSILNSFQHLVILEEKRLAK